MTMFDDKKPRSVPTSMISGNMSVQIPNTIQRRVSTIYDI